MFREIGGSKGKNEARETSREEYVCVTSKGTVYFDMKGDKSKAPAGLVLRGMAGSEIMRLDPKEMREMEGMGVTVNEDGRIEVRQVSANPGTLQAEAPKQVWIQRLREQFGLELAPGVKVD